MAGWLPLFAPPPALGNSARNLRIGAAGYTRGLDIADDDSVVTYADTYGAYLWDPTATSLGNAGGTGSWKQLITSSSISSSDPGAVLLQSQAFAGTHGCYEARFCKTNSNHIWLGFQGYLYKSTNKGVSFTNVTTPFTPAAASDMTANDGSLVKNNAGPKLAIDPINPLVVYFSLYGSKPWMTVDGGANWAQFTALANTSGTYNFNAIAIDRRVAVQSGGVCTRGFVAVNGTGVYISTNLGSGTPTFTKISGSGTSLTGLLNINRLIVDSQGALWATEYGGTANNVYRYSVAGTWTQFNYSGAGISTTAMNTFAEDRTIGSGARVIGFTDQMIGILSNNAQNTTPTWSGGFFPDNSVGTRVATDIPSLAQMTPEPLVGELQIDSTGKAWIATGIGIFTATIPSTFATTYNWTSRNSGIEGLTSVDIAHSPNGSAIVASWDRALYVSNLSTYPTTTEPQAFVFPPGSSSVDWATSATSTFAAMVFNDLEVWNGSAWTVRATGKSVSGGISSIACSDATNFMWMPNGLKPQYTTNAGVSWNDLGTYFSTNFSISSNVSLLNREQSVCADRVGTNTFYIHYGGCIFRTTNSGAAWTKMSTNGVASGIPSMVGGNPMLRAINGRQGHLLYCGGQTYQGSHPYTATTNLVRCTDGGTTWSDVSTIRDVWGIDSGPQIGSYPRIWAWGAVGGVFGYWYSDDSMATWTKQVVDLFDGRFDTVNWVEAHKTDATKFMVAFEGSGYGLYG
jgi:hypothetical protein